jgi:predicted AlkP superfamily pyrophosphatase or phosphodiesterase
MLKKGLGIIFLLLLIAEPVFGQSVAAVLIISIDALHPKALSGKSSPTLYALMKQGNYTLYGKSTDPPKTLIAHTAMFTGLEPAASGKTDNDWKPGEPGVMRETIFHHAKRRGYHTAFYYSKTKLGYLVNDAVDEHALAPDDGIDQAGTFLKNKGGRFVFLHVSGLEYEGSEYGWLSPEYLAELTSIDRDLGPLFEEVRKQGSYLLIVTSDHAGHDKLHGTSHLDDYRLPLIAVSDVAACGSIQDRPYRVTELKSLVEKVITSGSCSGRVK